MDETGYMHDDDMEVIDDLSEFATPMGDDLEVDKIAEPNKNCLTQKEPAVQFLANDEFVIDGNEDNELLDDVTTMGSNDDEDMDVIQGLNTLK